MRQGQITARRIRNRERVRAFLLAHVGATQKDCVRALRMNRETVRRHIADLRAEWLGQRGAPAKTTGKHTDAAQRGGA